MSATPSFRGSRLRGGPESAVGGGGSIIGSPAFSSSFGGSSMAGGGGGFGGGNGNFASPDSQSTKDMALYVQQQQPPRPRLPSVKHSSQFPKLGRPSTLSSKSMIMQMQMMESTGVFDVIKGPIQYQMLAHYIWYGFLLIIAHFTGWTYLWFWLFPLYIYSCFFAWEISRVFIFLNPNSMVPLYLSFLPYSVVHMFARQAHLQFGILWFVSIMTINLQISIQTLRIHVTAAVALFIALYAVLVISLEQVYNTPELQIYPVAMSLTNVRVEKCAPGANQYLQSLTLWSDTNLCLKATKVHIDWAAEATVMCCILLVGLSLHMLQAFIQEYAFNLIDRQNQVSKLSKQNEDLKTQLDSLKKEIVLDLDSPITKVIRSIKNIQEKCDLGADVMESLDYVIQILSSNQLFLPNLNVNNDAMDSDVNKWLTTMLTNKADNGPSTLPTLEEAPSVSWGALPKLVADIDDHILEYLSEINSWDFDIFKLVELTNGAPLYYLALAVIERHNLMPLFSLEPDVIKKFLRTIESGYKPVPYHNSTHAADVLHALHYFIAELGLSEIINSEEILACVVAAAIHDYAHPGVNNAFLINSGAPQALRYNDIAVLENFHCSSAFELMIADPSVNILGSLSRDRFKQVRASILSMVLATDMAGHFEYIAKFKNKLSGSGLQYEDAKDRQLLMDIAIKCGDINNAAKNLDLCRTWAGRIMEEFFQQGDLEKARALPVSMFMDRVTTEVPKCQVGFIDYLAMPLYEVWGLYATKEELAFAGLSNMAKNREYWRRLQDSELAAGS